MNLIRFSAPVALSALLLICLMFQQEARGQVAQSDPYIVNGSASEISCNCYTLTPQQFNLSGSVWNKNKIDLTQSFDYHFNVFLGCISDLNGADGMVFALQPISTSEGSPGDGMGFGGITPSLGVTIDTYQNLPDNDPSYDHIAFQSNGDVNHADSNNLAGPVTALAGSSNIKDCNWHVLEVNWNATTLTLTAYMDGALRLSMTKDIVNDIFQGNGLVYWGFTASTGGSDNLQEFCTSLNAGHSSPSGQRYCVNVPVVFADSSTSFGSIVEWFWNFGDGTTSNAENPPPHTYPAAGVYTVTENVLANNGCLSDTAKTILTIGTYPVMAFAAGNACTGEPIPITNNTQDSVGSIATWNWSLSNGQTFTDSVPDIVINTPGGYSLQLSAVSVEGCASVNTAATLLEVSSTPVVTFQGDSVCVGTALNLTGSSVDGTPIRQWYWQLGSILSDSGASITHTFTQEDTLQASLWAISSLGCVSDTVTGMVEIQTSHAYAGHDTAVALGYPIQLQATGGTSYQWSPATGLSNPGIADPIATLTEDTRYTVTAASSAGCLSSASLTIKVYKGPAIYVPGAFTPNGDGINDVLVLVAPGIRQLNFFRIFDRWGKQVYYSTSVQATWDGTISGKPVPPGTYVWEIQAIDLSGKTLAQKGTTFLIR
jgi:gliding motility-associated-like protein